MDIFLLSCLSFLSTKLNVKLTNYDRPLSYTAYIITVDTSILVALVNWTRGKNLAVNFIAENYGRLKEHQESGKLLLRQNKWK